MRRILQNTVGSSHNLLGGGRGCFSLLARSNREDGSRESQIGFDAVIVRTQRFTVLKALITTDREAEKSSHFKRHLKLIKLQPVASVCVRSVCLFVIASKLLNGTGSLRERGRACHFKTGKSDRAHIAGKYRVMPAMWVAC